MSDFTSILVLSLGLTTRGDSDVDMLATRLMTPRGLWKSSFVSGLDLKYVPSVCLQYHSATVIVFILCFNFLLHYVSKTIENISRV